MVKLEEIVEKIRNYASTQWKPLNNEDSRRPAEAVEKGGDVELLAEPREALKYLDSSFAKESLYFNIYAVDSSSRVVETPYVFLAITTGSLISRFTGKGLDCPPIGFITGAVEDACRFLTIIPNLQAPIEFDDKLSGFLYRDNPVGVRYDQDYNKYVLLEETRLLTESYLVSKSLEEGLLENSILLVDGPLIYPSTIEVSPPYSARFEVYKSSLEAINKERLSLWLSLRGRNTLAIGVVKRLYRSYYLSSCDPLGLGVPDINDEAYVSALSRSIAAEKGLQPYVLGPLRIRTILSNSVKVDRVAWYVGIPRRLYSSKTTLTHYTHYRVEVLGGMVDESVLKPVVYDSLNIGSLLPVSIIIADRRARKLSSILAQYLVFSMGLEKSGLHQYLTI